MLYENSNSTVNFPYTCCIKVSLGCGKNLVEKDIKDVIHTQSCLEKYVRVNDNALRLIFGTYIFSGLGFTVIILLLEIFLFKLRKYEYIEMEFNY